VTVFDADEPISAPAQQPPSNGGSSPMLGFSLVLSQSAAASTKWEALTLNDQGLFYIDPSSPIHKIARRVC